MRTVLDPYDVMSSTSISNCIKKTCFSAVLCSIKNDYECKIKNYHPLPVWDDTIQVPLVTSSSCCIEDRNIKESQNQSSRNELNDNNKCTHSSLFTDKSIQKMGNENLVNRNLQIRESSFITDHFTQTLTLDSDYIRTRRKGCLKEKQKIHQELVVGYSLAPTGLKCVCQNCTCKYCIGKKPEGGQKTAACKCGRKNEITGCNILVGGFDKALLIEDSRDRAKANVVLPPVIKITAYAVSNNDNMEPPAVACYEIIQKGGKKPFKCHCSPCKCIKCLIYKGDPNKKPFKCHCSPCKCIKCCEIKLSKTAACKCQEANDPCICQKDITGCRIFIKGLDQTKVINDTTKNPPVPSISLPKEIKMAIYAVNKCGKMESAAVAMYEVTGEIKPSFELPPVINMDLEAVKKSGVLELSSVAKYEFRKHGSK